MPSSQYDQINEIMNLIIHTHPDSLLDIGVGFGKYGFLSREYMDIYFNYGQKYDEPRLKIHGIEVFEKYITPVHRYIYDHIYIGNALEIIPSIKDRYSLILLIDVLEHFSYEDGIKLINACLKTGENIIISVPNNIREQGEVFGNPYEKHLFQWKKGHFNKYSEKCINRNIGGSMVVYLGEKSQNMRPLLIPRIRNLNNLKWFFYRALRFVKRKLN